MTSKQRFRKKLRFQTPRVLDRGGARREKGLPLRPESVGASTCPSLWTRLLLPHSIWSRVGRRGFAVDSMEVGLGVLSRSTRSSCSCSAVALYDGQRYAFTSHDCSRKFENFTESPWLPPNKRTEVEPLETE